MKQSDKLKELLEELHKLAEETALYLPIIESLDCEENKSKEPLIKDEKIRKAVRAWAYSNSTREIVYTERMDICSCSLTDIDYNFAIQFAGWIPTLKDAKKYTIAELCGEEE